MARKAMVTRTIKGTKVSALCVDTVEQKTYVKDVTLGGTYDDEKSLNKALSAVINDNTNRYVSVIATEVFETLYGMDETEFIAHAEVLPPRSVKEEA